MMDDYRKLAELAEGLETPRIATWRIWWTLSTARVSPILTPTRHVHM